MDIGTAVSIISIFWFVSEVLLMIMMRSLPSDEHRDKSSIRIIWISIIVSITAGIFLSHQRVGHVGNGSRIFPYTGIFLILFGLIVRWIAILSLKRQFTVDVSIRENHHIITNGVYHFVRHPSYTGSLLSFLGLGICFSNYLSAAVIFIPILGAFLYRIRIEEEVLVQAFGDEYRNYAAVTKRLLPGIY